MEQSRNIDAQQRTLTRSIPYDTSSGLGTFYRYRPEVDILPGRTWKCSMRSAFY